MRLKCVDHILSVQIHDQITSHFVSVISAIISVIHLFLSSSLALHSLPLPLSVPVISDSNYLV